MKLALVTKTTAPIMKEPRFETETSDEAICGMSLEILEELQGGWYYVNTHYNYKGYLHDNFISIDTEKTLKWKEEAQNIVKHTYVDVMKNPKFQSYIIQNLTKGAIIKITDKVFEGWSKIILPDEREGWIKTVFIEEYRTSYDKKNEEELRNKFVETALEYIGTQYRWGGKTPLGIDCSGLCSIAYLINGVKIYRDANIKEEFDMKEISKEEMKKGDLIFFPGHIAMYIGNDKYVHSSSSNNGVYINSLNSEHKDYKEDLAKTIIKYGSIFN